MDCKEIIFLQLNYAMNIEQIIKSFDTVPSREITKVKLQTRFDSKFIFRDNLMPLILEQLKDDYKILTQQGHYSSSFETLYFDTPKNLFYRDHHNGKRNRIRIRYRKQVESESVFFEINYQNKKGRATKKKIAVADIKTELGQVEIDFLRKVLKKKQIEKLRPYLSNSFSRIILYSKDTNERITLDFNEHFGFQGKNSNFPGVVFAEIEQEILTRNSPFLSVLKKLIIRSEKIGKYSFGMSIFGKQKSNSFKEIKIRINKIIETHD